MNKTAIISECGQYRYALTRTWDESLPKVMFLMLNPSTADANKDDATICRCIGFAKLWGYGGIIVGNLFAFRSTKPDNLLKAGNPIGPGNEASIKQLSTQVDIIVYAWGNGYMVDRLCKLYPNYKPLAGLEVQARYLKLMKGGHPRHPLYLRSDMKPLEYKINPIKLAT
jgi:hypothetical protein